MIDIRKLKELVRLMVANDLTEVDLRDNEEQVTLRRDRQTGLPMVTSGHAQLGVPAPMHHPAMHAAPGAAPPQPANAAPATGAADADSAVTDDNLHTIASPMIGTFYTAANPDSPPFVSVGSNVDEDTVVCLVEAMKIFNELKAECSGTIARILVKNGEAVEFGQPLFKVKPD